MSDRALRVGLWGPFDAAEYGDALVACVTEAELGSRLPVATVTRYAPMGWERWDPFDEGRPARPLGPWSEDRLAALAAEVDAVVVTGADVIGLDERRLGAAYGLDAAAAARRAPGRFFAEGLGVHERDVPVFWSAVGVAAGALDGDAGPLGRAGGRLGALVAGRRYTTVRDRRSRDRLVAAGAPPDAVTVVPDPALVLDRVVDPGLLDQRARVLQALGWYPPGRAVVVNGDKSLVPLADELAAQLRKVVTDLGDAEIVILETSRRRGDAEFADELTARLDDPPWRIPATVGLADVAAAIALADLFVGSSVHGSLTAFVHGVPSVRLDLAGGPGAALPVAAEADHAVTAADDLFEASSNARGAPRPAALLADLQQQVDDHFTRLADEILDGAAHRREDGAARPPDASYRRLNELEREVVHLRAALEARARNTRRTEDRVLEQLAEHRAAHAELVAARAEWMAELDAVRAEAAAVPELAERARRADDLEQRLDRIMHSRSVRWTAPARRTAARWRRRTRWRR